MLMLTVDVVLILLLTVGGVAGEGFVKVANFYNDSVYDDRIVSLKLSPKDLVVLAVDRVATLNRLPLRDIPFYGISQQWNPLNGTVYFGRLSLFTTNLIDVEVEHNILRFQDNMTLSNNDRSLMVVTRNEVEQNGKGIFCNIGPAADEEVTMLYFCFNDLKLDLTRIKIFAQNSNCKRCTRYKLSPQLGGLNSLSVSLPAPETTPWNVTLQYRNQNNRHTTLCQFTESMGSRGDHVVVMRENLTVSTMFECVVFTEERGSSSTGLWIGIVCCIAGVILCSVMSVVLYKKCDKACIRELMPTPDQDSAPFRSLNSESPYEHETNSQYCRMEASVPDHCYDNFKYDREAMTSRSLMTSSASGVTSHGGWKSKKINDQPNRFMRGFDNFNFI